MTDTQTPEVTGNPDDPQEVALSPDLRRLADWRDWSGWLTLENFEAVADRIRRLLDGRTYTWVASNEGQRAYFPEVRTGQRLCHDHARSGNAVMAKLLAPDHGHLTVVDSYGVWGLSTSIPDQSAAHKLGFDAACKAGAHLTFHRAMGSRPDRLEIEHFAPVGARLYWVAAIEPRDDDGD